jgi:hypothetical protein
VDDVGDGGGDVEHVVGEAAVNDVGDGAGDCVGDDVSNGVE